MHPTRRDAESRHAPRRQRCRHANNGSGTGKGRIGPRFVFGDSAGGPTRRTISSGIVPRVSLMVSELAAKRLALLKEAVPGISRVLVLAFSPTRLRRYR
jgi:hypothetical protein